MFLLRRMHLIVGPVVQALTKGVNCTYEKTKKGGIFKPPEGDSRFVSGTVSVHRVMSL